MNKREKYVTLELSGDKLDMVVTELQEKLLREFWSHVPEGAHREQIRQRLERSILGALDSQPHEPARV